MAQAGWTKAVRVTAVVAMIAAMFAVHGAEPAGALCLPTDLSTGGAVPGVDADWQVFPPGSTTGSGSTNVSVNSWVTPASGTSWISESAATASGASAGSWRYRFTFVAPASAPMRPLTFRYASDNGVTFLLDGVPIGGYTGTNANDHTPFNQFHTIATPTRSWLPGPHTIEAVVNNFGGPTGLVVNGSLNICAPECAAAPILVRVSNADFLAVSAVSVQGIGSSSDDQANGTNSVGSVMVTYQGAYASCTTTATTASARSGVARARISDGVNTIDIDAGYVSVSTTSTSHTHDCTTAEVIVNGTPVGGCFNSVLFAPVLVLDDQIDIGNYHEASVVHVQLGAVDVYIGYAHVQV